MKKIFTLLVLLLSDLAMAQCTFDPTVTGDSLLCPNANDTLSTQIYDSYQWYKRPISGTAQPVSGAVFQTLAIDYFNDAGYYFSVEATDNACTEMSPEVLVDGYVFLLPTVQTTGNFTIGPNGETVICEGDTVYFTLLQPYDTNITWFKDGSPIAGAISTVLAVTDSGEYWLEGAPSICPDFVQQLGVTLTVQVINCGTGIKSHQTTSVNFYWNASDDFIYMRNIPSISADIHVNLFTVDGRKIFSEKISVLNGGAKISTAHFPKGIYFCEIYSDHIAASEKIAILK